MLGPAGSQWAAPQGNPGCLKMVAEDRNTRYPHKNNPDKTCVYVYGRLALVLHFAVDLPLPRDVQLKLFSAFARSRARADHEGRPVTKRVPRKRRRPEGKGPIE